MGEAILVLIGEYTLKFIISIILWFGGSFLWLCIGAIGHTVGDIDGSPWPDVLVILGIGIFAFLGGYGIIEL